MARSTHSIYSYMASDIWLRTTQIAREETRCRHIGYSFRLAARVLLYAPSHRQDSTYDGLCYTSRGALVGTGNSVTVLHTWLDEHVDVGRCRLTRHVGDLEGEGVVTFLQVVQVKEGCAHPLKYSRQVQYTNTCWCKTNNNSYWETF